MAKEKEGSTETTSGSGSTSPVEPTPPTETTPNESSSNDAPTASADGAPGPGSDLARQLERDRAELKAAQEELARLRQAEKERQEAELSELEKTKKHLEEARAEAQRQTERNQKLIKEQALQRAAASRGVKRQSAIAKLVDWSKVELNDDGDVVGLDEALDEVETAVPELFGSTEAEPNPTTSAPTTGAGKQSDRNLGDDQGFDDGRELGRAIRKRVANKKNSTRL